MPRPILRRVPPCASTESVGLAARVIGLILGTSPSLVDP